jgi:hypothetical protein
VAATFLELRNYARERTSTENNQALTEDVLGKMLNMSLGAFYSLITTTYEDYNLWRYLATITTGNQIPLPPDFAKLRGVDFGAPGQWTTVFGYNLQERNRNNNPIANMVVPFGNLAARKVRVMGRAIYVEPEQLCSGQYQIWYTPKYQWLISDTQEVGPEMDIDGMVEYAIAATGIKIYNKLGLSAAGFIDEMKYYSDLAIESLASRMNSGPEVVANVTSISDWGYSELGMGSTAGGW